jgi:nitroreductase
MELDEALEGRRSVRSYLAKGVSLELVKQVIKAAMLAPSAKNGQQWQFTVLIGKPKKELTDFFMRELEKISKRARAYLLASAISL